MKRFLVVMSVVLVWSLVFCSLTFAFNLQDRQLAIKVGQRLSSNAYVRGGSSAYLDKWIQRQIENIFWDVAREASRMVDLPYSLYILSSSEPDGWSYCDGSVYITMGIVRKLEYSHEYAALFGHLIAHAVRKHHIGMLLETEQGRSFLEDIADGKIGVSQSDLGKYAVYLLATSHSMREEDEADSLGEELAYRAGYGKWGLDSTYSKIAAYSSTCAFFSSHPHSGVQPYSYDDSSSRYPSIHESVSGEVVIGVEPEKSSVRVPVEVFVDAGQYPFNVISGETILHYCDSEEGPADDYYLQLSQASRSSQTSIGIGLALGISKPLYVTGRFGFGLDSGVFKGSTSANTFMMELGLGAQFGDENMTVKAGGFWTTLNHSSQVGRVEPAPGGTGAQEMNLYNYYRIPHGTPIVASCSGSGFGAYASIDIPISRDAVCVSLTAKYQSINGRGYRFTVNHESNKTIEIPYKGEYPNPFTATGVAICGGLKIRY
jgi:hypothetical protein